MKTTADRRPPPRPRNTTAALVAIIITQLFCSSLLGADVSFDGRVDVLNGPVTVGSTYQFGGFDPNNWTQPLLTLSPGLSIRYWNSTPSGYVTQNTPNTTTVTFAWDDNGNGPENPRWNYDDGSLHATGAYVYDYNSNPVDGDYSVGASAVVYDGRPSGNANTWSPGSFDISFDAFESDGVINWTAAGTPIMSLSASPIGGPGTYPTGTLSVNAINAYDMTINNSLVGQGANNSLPYQTLNAGASSILTKSLADGLYVSKSSSTPLTGFPAARFGGGLVAGTNAYQTIFGAFNVASNSDIFVIGAGSGTAANQRKNALTVSTAGNTSINGNLFVSGTTSLAGLNAGATSLTTLGVLGGVQAGSLNVTGTASITGQLTQGGQPVLNQVASDARYFQKVANSFSFGTNSVAGSNYSVALGIDSQASTSGTTTGDSSFAFGTKAKAGVDAFVAGILDSGVSPPAVRGTNAYLWGGGQSAVAIGKQTFAGHESAAIGIGAYARYASLALGQYSTAFGTGSFALGYYSRAIGGGSIAWGNQCGANGEYSMAIGLANNAGGAGAMVFGKYSGAGGADSLAMGFQASAQTDNSIALGRGVEASRWGQVVLGTFNDPTSYSNAVPQAGEAVPLFVIGNGLSASSRSNAFVVKRNGDTEVKGGLTVVGTITQNGQPLVVQDSLAGYVQKPSDALALGTNASAATGGWAIGINAIASAGSVSIGELAGANGVANAFSGFRSVGIGYQARPQGAHAVSIGHGTLAQGESAIAIGWGSSAEQGGVAIGRSAVSNKSGQIVLGAFNALSASSPVPELEELFVIGNGTGQDARSNAFVIRRNAAVEIYGPLTATSANFSGNVNIAGGTLTQNGNPVITQNSTGGLTLGSGTVASGTNAMALGQDTTASGTGSFAQGDGVEATGEYSFAFGVKHQHGRKTISSGWSSVAMGQAVHATGTFALATGSFSTATGEGSVAIGRYNTAGANYATAIGGYNSAAYGDRSVVIGVESQARYKDQVILGSFAEYDDAVLNPSASPTDPLFVIGNGTSGSRSNAFVIRRNGDAELKGDATIEHDLKVKGNTTAEGVIIITQPAGGISMGEFAAP